MNTFAPASQRSDEIIRLREVLLYGLEQIHWPGLIPQSQASVDEALAEGDMDEVAVAVEFHDIQVGVSKFLTAGDNLQGVHGPAHEGPHLVN